MTDRTTAIVRFTFEGFHRWPGATGRRSYLADLHRHMFHVECQLETFHDEREVEFHDLLNDARRARGALVPHRSDYSCETMARLIGEQLGDKYPGRYLSVSVTEDNENGARIDFTPDPDDRSSRVHH